MGSSLRLGGLGRILVHIPVSVSVQSWCLPHHSLIDGPQITSSRSGILDKPILMPSLEKLGCITFVGNLVQ